MEDVQKFGTSIKKKYQERLINCEKQWPPCHSDKLVRLEIVERKKGEGYSANTQRGRDRKGLKRSPLAYGDLFKEESGKRQVRKVLVEGDAGIGKTTLCIAVSEGWANGKLFQQFELVFLLPLRMKVVASAGSLPELLKLLHPSPRLCDSVARYLEEEEGERVLIIADGWDELSESERKEGGFLYQLLFEQFPFLSVILTSRPSASASLHLLPCIDRFVEVHGFSKEHIVEYIQSEFASDQEKAARLLEQLEYNPLIDSVCSVPLNCAIVCNLWRTLEEALPTTMTELYTKIILQIILRNIRKLDGYKSVLSLPSFDVLPADLQQSWWLLCKFAFQALEKDQLVFSLEELKAFFPEGLASDKRILCFGLLQSTESVGFGMSFHFLHLTFQEYLAAMHLARQSPDKQLEFFQSHKSRGQLFFNRFIMMNKFFFGINHFEISDVSTNIIQQMFECVAGKNLPDTLSLCHFAFEGHSNLPVISDQLTQYLVNHSSNRRIDFGFPRTAHDCTAVTFAISNIQESVTMKIRFTSCGLRENQIIRFVDILAHAEGKLQITNLDMSGNRLTISGLQALERAVGGDLFAKLEMLDLSGSLTSDADANAAWLTTFAEALSTHCPQLFSLNLSDNNLGVPGVSALSRFFVTDYSTCGKPSAHTFRLILNKANLGDEGLVILIKSLTLVRFLSLIGNDIHSFGISCLADAVCSGKLKLRQHGQLYFSDNPLGLEGSIAFARIISSSHCQLMRVKLSRCELTTGAINPSGTESLNTRDLSSVAEIDTTGQQLCQMPQSSTIPILQLNGNRFKGEGIHILAGFIHLCPCMKLLSTTDCDITSDDLIWLLDRLNQLKSSSPNLFSELESWYLENNLLDDRGISALIDHLPSLFPRLACKSVHDNIFLKDNPISSEMKKILEKELKRRREEFQTTRKKAAIISKDFTVEQKEPSSSKLVPSSATHIPLPESAVDNAENVSASTLASLSPTSLPLSHAAIQCGDQPENQQLQNESCSDTVLDISLDLRPPPSQRPKDFTSLPDVEHHFVDLIKWWDENGVQRELRIYSKIAHKWRQIATRLGFELGEIESVEENHHRNDSRITAVLRRWFENARSLPNAGRYPKSWQGLINLLEDAELGEVAEELKKALSSPQNTVRGNLY